MVLIDNIVHSVSTGVTEKQNLSIDVHVLVSGIYLQYKLHEPLIWMVSYII